MKLLRNTDMELQSQTGSRHAPESISYKHTVGYGEKETQILVSTWFQAIPVTGRETNAQRGGPTAQWKDRDSQHRPTIHSRTPKLWKPRFPLSLQQTRLLAKLVRLQSLLVQFWVNVGCFATGISLWWVHATPDALVILSHAGHAAGKWKKFRVWYWLWCPGFRTGLSNEDLLCARHVPPGMNQGKRDHEQRMWAASKRWKRHGNRFSPTASRKNQPCQHLDCGPVIPILDFWPQGLRDNRFMLF